ncbi:MAG: tetratricopeptide repeat protein, partial [Sphingomonadales bacterium]
MMSDPEAAQRELAAAEALARNIVDTRQRRLALATVSWLSAEANLRNDAPEKAGPILAQGLKMIAPITEPIKLRGDLLMSQGAWLMQSDQAAQALKNYQDAFEIFGKVNQSRSQAIALQNIAVLYTEANDNQSAEKYLAQAAKTHSGDPALSVSLHNNRGNVLMLLDRYGDAEAEYAEGVRIARAMNDPLLEAWVLSNLARSQVDARKFDAAQATLDRGFALTRGADASAMRRHFLATAARLAGDRGDFARATQLIRECFAGLDLTATGVELRTAHLFAYNIFRETGDLGAALTHLEALKRLSDEAAKVATTTSAQLMAAKFDYQGQQLQIERLAREQERATAQFQRTLFVSIGLATLIVIAALAWGLVSIRRSRNKVAAANIVLA